MLSLAGHHFPARANRPDFEFHGSDLFGGNGDCQGFSPPDRIAIYKELMELLTKYECAVFVRGIDKARHQQRALSQGYAATHPHEIASMYLFEKIDEWLETASTPSQPTYGLLVADEQKEVARKTVENFASWRQAGTVGYRRRPIKFLIDTVHYVPSHDSWLIQLADCVAFVRNRYARILRTKGADKSRYTNSDNAIFAIWEEQCENRVISDVTWP